MPITEKQKQALKQMHLPRIKEMSNIELVNRIIYQSQITNMNEPYEVYFLKLFKVELLKRLKVNYANSKLHNVN